MNFVVGNSNGIVDNIYYYLWMKNDIIDAELDDVSIPDTVVFKDGLPQIWYFCSKKTGKVLVHKADFRTIENIIEVFTRNIGSSNIVAYFIQQYEEETADRPIYNFQKRKLNPSQRFDLDEKVSIIHLNEQMFRQYINDPKKLWKGILQKYIEPYGSRETMIQAIWSPNISFFSKRMNIKEVNDIQYDPQERCSTFGAPQILSMDVPLRGHEISNQIRKLADRIIQKVRGVTFEKYVITRAVFYFKPDKKNKIFFAYCSSIRTSTEKVDQFYDSKGKLQNFKNTPLSLENNFILSDEVKRTLTINTNHKVKMMKDIECVDCGFKCQQSDLYGVSHSLIIKTHDQFIQQKNQPNYKEEIFSNLQMKINIKEPPAESAVVLITKQNKEQQENQQIQKRKSIITVQDVNPKEQKIVMSADAIVPSIFRKMYPKITPPIYMVLKYSEQFLKTQIFLCENCFVKYCSSAAYKINGVQPNLDRTKSVKIQPATIQQRLNFTSFFSSVNQELKTEQKIKSSNKRIFSSKSQRNVQETERSQRLLSEAHRPVSSLIYTHKKANKSQNELELQSNLYLNLNMKKSHNGNSVYSTDYKTQTPVTRLLSANLKLEDSTTSLTLKVSPKHLHHRIYSHKQS